MKFMFFLLVTVFSVFALAQSPSPSVAPVAASGGLIDFLKSNLGVVSGLAVAILDFVFALNPNANAPDGILHGLYMLLKGLGGNKPPAA